MCDVWFDHGECSSAVSAGALGNRCLRVTSLFLLLGQMSHRAKTPAGATPHVTSAAQIDEPER